MTPQDIVDQVKKNNQTSESISSVLKDTADSIRNVVTTQVPLLKNIGGDSSIVSSVKSGGSQIKEAVEAQLSQSPLLKMGYDLIGGITKDIGGLLFGKKEEEKDDEIKDNLVVEGTESLAEVEDNTSAIVNYLKDILSVISPLTHGIEERRREEALAETKSKLPVVEDLVDDADLMDELAGGLSGGIAGSIAGWVAGLGISIMGAIGTFFSSGIVATVISRVFPIVAIANMLFGGITDAIEKYKETGSITETLLGFFVGIGNTVVSMVGGLLDLVTGGLVNTDKLKQGMSYLSEKLSSGMSMLSSVFSSISNTISESVKVFSFIWDNSPLTLISDTLSWITKQISETFSIDNAKSILNVIWKYSPIKMIVDTLGWIYTKIENIFSVDAVMETIDNLLKNNPLTLLIDGIKLLWSKLSGVVDMLGVFDLETPETTRGRELAEKLGTTNKGFTGGEVSENVLREQSTEDLNALLTYGKIDSDNKTQIEKILDERKNPHITQSGKRDRVSKGVGDTTSAIHDKEEENRRKQEEGLISMNAINNSKTDNSRTTVLISPSVSNNDTSFNNTLGAL